MATRLGPAFIEVDLDTKKVNADLDALEKRLGKLKVVNREERDEDRTYYDKRKEDDSREIQKAREIHEDARQGRFGAGFKLAAAAAGVVGTALLMEKVILPGVAGAVRGSFEGTPMEGAAQRLSDDLLLAVSKQITEFRSLVDAAIPTYENVKDVGRAQLLLGEAPTAGEIGNLSEIFWKVNRARSLEERTREKLVPEMIGEVVGNLFRQGAMRQ